MAEYSPAQKGKSTSKRKEVARQSILPTAGKIRLLNLFHFTRWQHSSTLSGALAAAVVSAGLKTGLAVILGKVFQVVVAFGAGTLDGESMFREVSMWAAVLCGFGLGTWIFNAAFLAAWIVFGELQAKSARNAVFCSLLQKSMPWYDSQQDGISSLLVRVETEVRELQTATSQVLGFLVCDTITSISSLAVAFFFSYRLTLVLLATMPIALALIILITRGLEPAIQAQKQSLATASKHANASLSAIDLVKVFNGYDHEVWEFLQALKSSMRNYLRQANRQSMQIGIVIFWVIMLFVVGFWYGITLIDQGLQPDAILTTFYAVLAAFQGIEALMPQWLVLVKGMSAGHDLRQMTRDPSYEEPKMSEGSRGIRPERCVGDLELRNVSFAYPSNPTSLVIQPSSFHFPTGELTFIVGKSGSGKSTLGNLILRFYEPLAGDILIDGIPLQTLGIDWVRRNITLTHQSSLLFNESFFMNVAFGHLYPDRVAVEEVRVACEAALLQSTITGLPRGLNTLVGAGGHALSGGEKQRLVLARARLRDTPILILDEVTSGLDQVTKELVMEAIRKWRRGKTTIVITHDVSQIHDGDFIYVMDHSRLVQEGFCRDLANCPGGLFSSLLRASEQRIPSPTSPNKTSNTIADGKRDTRSAPDGRTKISSQFESFFIRELERSAYSPSRRLSTRTALGGPAATFATTLRSTQLWDQPIDDSTPKRSLSGRWDNRRSQPWRSASVNGAMHLPRIEDTTNATSSKDSLELVEKAGYNVQNDRINSQNIRHRQPRSNINPESEGLEDKNNDRIPSRQRTKSLLAILKTIWPTLSPHERVIFLIGLLMCPIAAAATPAFAYAFSQLLTAFWAPTSAERLGAGRLWACILIAIGLVNGLSAYFAYYLLEWTGQAWVNHLRVEALKCILHQPKAWFNSPRNAPGRIAECLDRDAEESRNLVGRFLPILVMVVTMILTSIVWSLAISWKLTLVALTGVPVIIGSTKAFAVVSTRWESRCNVAAENASAVLAETFVNVSVVRALTLENHFAAKHDKATSTTLQLGLKRARYSSPLFGLYQSTNYFLTALVYYYGAVLLIKKGEISIMAILQVINLLLLGMGTATAILSAMPQISAARATSLQLLRYANLKTESLLELKRKRKIVTPFPVRMMGLSFAYPSRPYSMVLRNLTLELDAGTCTALVGPSGCGKSTVVSLLLGLHAPYAGVESGSASTLSFDSLPVDIIDLHHLRSMLAYVPQISFLFPVSIFENIAYGLREDSPLRALSNIITAAHEAGLHDFITSLPEGYATLVGEGGQGLSGGQAQRMCIARALAHRPKLLVMDEPTSALDAESAEMMRHTISSLIRMGRSQEGMGVVVVTHSKEMMRIADRILMMDGGRIVEDGSFDELWSRGGQFAHMIGGGQWVEGVPPARSAISVRSEEEEWWPKATKTARAEQRHGRRGAEPSCRRRGEFCKDELADTQ